MIKSLFNRKNPHIIAWLAVFLVCSQVPVFSESGLVHTKKFGGLNDDEVISMRELRQRQLRHDHLILIDARGKKSYEEGHLENAILSLPEDYYKKEALFKQGIIAQSPSVDQALSDAMASYPKGTPIVTYCNDGCQASAVLLLKIKRLGFQNVRAMEGGFQSWQSKGYPIIMGKS